MTDPYDAIVVGVGGMGSAALYHLASRGLVVLGIEQFDVPHAMGSSHGVNRIIRKAYFEHPSYVPLLLRSYELWDELEEVSGRRLLVKTGGVDAAPGHHQTFLGALRAAQMHSIEHEVLTGPEVNARFPGYRLSEDHLAVFQPDSGYVMSEEGIVAHVNGALANGATVHGRERVIGWGRSGDFIEVATQRGRYMTSKLVITAGAWSSGVGGLPPALAVPERQVLAWFQPLEPSRFDPSVFPIFNLEIESGHFYGFPIETIPGFKIGLYHHLKEDVDPDDLDREVTDTDLHILRSAVDEVFPMASGPVLSMKTCMFTNTPDEHFIVDFHPQDDDVVVAAGFSGHGYKFTPVIGEILADLAVAGQTRHDIGLLRLGRFE